MKIVHDLTEAFWREHGPEIERIASDGAFYGVAVSFVRILPVQAPMISSEELKGVPEVVQLLELRLEHIYERNPRENIVRVKPHGEASAQLLAEYQERLSATAREGA